MSVSITALLMSEYYYLTSRRETSNIGMRKNQSGVYERLEYITVYIYITNSNLFLLQVKVIHLSLHPIICCWNLAWMLKATFGFGDFGMLGIRALTRRRRRSPSLPSCGTCLRSSPGSGPVSKTSALISSKTHLPNPIRPRELISKNRLLVNDCVRLSVSLASVHAIRGVQILSAVSGDD